ncbi:hypothetical protein DSI31_05235 [Mycobacterium tuberculosis]|nr:hypothetical protein DSI31_05235 [Mycobacterium tuberculosis]REM67169.1 hypothetical protein DSI38_12440 [Mycobacterium tuberculosis]REW13992.1 hypothetical protein DSK68_14820 [Mycobacterium tuberculosis]
MAADQRGWYRDWWRRKTGYVERSSFRLGEDERKQMRHAKAWRRNWLVVLFVLLAFVGVKVVFSLGRQ